MFSYPRAALRGCITGMGLAAALLLAACGGESLEDLIEDTISASSTWQVVLTAGSSARPLMLTLSQPTAEAVLRAEGVQHYEPEASPKDTTLSVPAGSIAVFIVLCNRATSFQITGGVAAALPQVLSAPADACANARVSATFLPPPALGLGFDHSCAILNGGTAGGEAYCWGSNQTGQLGNGSTTGSNRPQAVQANSGGSTLGGVLSLAAGGSRDTAHTCAVLAGRTALCWGANGNQQLGLGSSPTLADCDLGSGERNNCSLRPQLVAGLGGSGVLGGVLRLAAGEVHTCAVVDPQGDSPVGRADDEVRCWGTNSAGQLGDGTSLSRQAPVAVVERALSSTALQGVAAVGLGNSHSCALLQNSGVKCWGAQLRGSLGNNDDRAALVSAPVDVHAIQSSSDTTALSGALSLSVGLRHACIVHDRGSAGSADDVAKCWGEGNAGRLGDGAEENNLAPAEVAGLGGSGILSGVAAVSAGRLHSCALLHSGSALCWGDGLNGRLGGGDGHSVSLLPLQVSRLNSGVTALRAGGVHTCAVHYGQLKCWGAGAQGALGNGNPTNQIAPVNVLQSGL